MKIESKATGTIHFISQEDFDKMDVYKKRKYTIIDKSDRMIPSIEVKEIKIAPKDVFEEDFEKDVKEILDTCTRADIKEMLDEEGLDYNRDDKHRELAEIYLEWKTKNY